MSGLHKYRFAQNPEEQRIAKAWDKAWNEFAKHHLAYLLHVGEQNPRPPEPSDRDRVVAATVIQWLGSPVGQSWLSELGYEKVPK